MLQRDASEEEVSYSDEEEDESEEDEEEELRSKLLDVSVTEEPPPGFPSLTKHQLSQCRDALNVRHTFPKLDNPSRKDALRASSGLLSMAHLPKA